MYDVSVKVRLDDGTTRDCNFETDSISFNSNEPLVFVFDKISGASLYYDRSRIVSITIKTKSQV